MKSKKSKLLQLTCIIALFIIAFSMLACNTDSKDKKEVTVSFDLNYTGAPTNPADKTYKVGDKYADLPTVTRTDYVFNGWFASATGGDSVTSDTEVTKTEKHRLYAHWLSHDEPSVQVEIRFDLGYVGGETINPRVYTVGQPYGELPTVAERTGYTFKGWFTQDVDGDKITAESIVTNATAHILYAQWTQIPATQVVVSFNLNYGNDNAPANPEDMTYNLGDKYTDLPTPLRSGWGFDGWYTAKNGGTLVDANTEITNPTAHTLWARWSEEEGTEYKIIYHNMENAEHEIGYPTKYTSGERTGLKQATHNESELSFEGWQLQDNNGTNSLDAIEADVAGDLDLYAMWSTRDGDYDYTLINGGEEYSISAGNTLLVDNIDLPSEYNNKPITEIGADAFYGCTSLTSITIPNSVTSIGDWAFMVCRALTNITIPSDSKLTSIGYYAFYSCTSLTSITIPSGVTSIGDRAFTSCIALTSITIPSDSKLTSIGYGVFDYCSALTSITIPISVTSIGDSAFERCSSLTINVKIGESSWNDGDKNYTKTPQELGEDEYSRYNWSNGWNSDNRPVVWGYAE